jgi:hypothetical protein
MIVVGIDPSFTGFAMSDGSRTVAVGTKANEIAERCKTLLGAFDTFMRDVAPEETRDGWSLYEPQFVRPLFVIEKPMPTTRNVMHLYNMGWLMCHLHYYAERVGATILEVPAGTLKIFVCGNGGANKVDVAVAVSKRWAVDFPGDRDGNKSDAYALYQFGMAHLRGENPGVRPAKPKKSRKKTPA